MHKRAKRNVLWNEKHVRDASNCRIAQHPDDPTGPEPERFTFVLHDLAQPPTAEQVAQGGLAPYVDGIYASAIFAANPLADFTDPDTSDGITPQLTERRLYAEAVDALLAREDALGEITFDLTDYLGSIRAWTDPSGAILESLGYDSFGNPAYGIGAGTRFGFAARRWSDLSGHFYMRARHYEPMTARFSAQDPLGLHLLASNGSRALAPQSISLGQLADGYVFALNSPLVNSDPLGLFASRRIRHSVNGAAGGLIGGTAGGAIWAVTAAGFLVWIGFLTSPGWGAVVAVSLTGAVSGAIAGGFAGYSCNTFLGGLRMGTLFGLLSRLETALTYTAMGLAPISVLDKRISPGPIFVSLYHGSKTWLMT